MKKMHKGLVHDKVNSKNDLVVASNRSEASLMTSLAEGPMWRFLKISLFSLSRLASDTYVESHLGQQLVQYKQWRTKRDPDSLFFMFLLCLSASGFDHVQCAQASSSVPLHLFH